MYLLEDYDYNLSEGLIAQEPASSRDKSRIMRVDRSKKEISGYFFYDLPRILKPGDLLVVNDVEVTPARLYGRKATGGKVEVLVLEQGPDRENGRAPDERCCLVKASKRPKQGSGIIFDDGFTGEIIDSEENGRMLIRFKGNGSLDEFIKKRGCLPLPPYIKRDTGDKRISADRERYQTIFSRTPGAVAAPTAGLHFTNGLVKKLKSLKVTITPITLFVGYDTFRPVREQDIRKHRLEEESYFISPESAAAVKTAKDEGRRIVAVGTTVVRTLETVYRKKSGIEPDSGITDLFIYPGFEFKVVDALITNFHLPRSSLLILVTAFGGFDLTMKAYKLAKEAKYRFFSYGDAMLIM